MSKAIDVFIVEDEIVIAHDIKGALESKGYSVVGVAKDYKSAIKVFDLEKPDLVLLDITLKGDKTGIDVAKHIRSHFSIPFIFITSHADSNTIQNAVITKPNGYLIKPFNEDDLYAAIEVALQNYNENSNDILQDESSQIDKSTFSDSIFIKSGGLYNRIKLDEIHYLEADGVYTNVYTKESKYTDRKILLDYEKLLDTTKFMRIHRSYVVNVKHIQGIKTDEVIIGSNKIPMGRTHKEKLMALIS